MTQNSELPAWPGPVTQRVALARLAARARSTLVLADHVRIWRCLLLAERFTTGAMAPLIVSELAVVLAEVKRRQAAQPGVRNALLAMTD